MASADRRTTACYGPTDWKNELRDIAISTQATNPTPIITSLNAFTRDVDHFAAALYNIDGRLTALTDNLQRLENTVDGRYD